MTTALRWWPVFAVAGLFLLGWGVGQSSTPLDDRLLAIDAPDVLLILVWPPLLVAVLGGTVAVALWRRQWKLAVVVVVCPPAAIVTAQLLKRVFDRQLDGALAYPSGHTTALVVTAGMVVLVAGARRWAVFGAVAATLVGMVAVGLTFHYFTDTVGALLWGSAVVALAARLADWSPHRST
ncbi:phosphatase PAP2 family protein [Mycobacterium sp. PS03-16]|uniref:phosphatase PAP2 family protein n=1 Tax=Mycobacterium sp. PS03-16 TaxID=2559611 RepID=UPI0010748D30|nr:phosphatase PAP2 family protein [Mycobacterium sp. PS03-16]TFV59232.1 phosphatase PAP2 family protein [Mycobacterium sp. PS03-16]